jgi:hypothetical protein
MSLKNITDVLVNTVSLVTSKETPAVPKATTKFSLFKTKKKKMDVAKLKEIREILESE